MRRFIAEFEEQSFTQIIFPHSNTDWAEYLDETDQSVNDAIERTTSFATAGFLRENRYTTPKH